MDVMSVKPFGLSERVEVQLPTDEDDHEVPLMQDYYYAFMTVSPKDCVEASLKKINFSSHYGAL